MLLELIVADLIKRLFEREKAGELSFDRPLALDQKKKESCFIGVD
jgi:hypothetical protein